MDKGASPSAGDLKVWWIPQVPMKAFEVPVTDIGQAAFVMSVLSDYDAFQYENSVKPDYCNVGGLVVFEDGEWCDWWDDEGRDIGDLRRDPEALAQAIEARRAETLGSVYESAVAESDAPETTQAQP